MTWPTYEEGPVRLVHGDCREVLATLEANSVDGVVTDPPAGISFMGVAWDTFGEGKGAPRGTDDWDATGGKEHARTAEQEWRIVRKQGVRFRQWLTPILEECRRVLKPGGHAVVWALPRTSHWTATALEDAGFVLRDVCVHLVGQGFPKSYDVAKGLDALAATGSANWNEFRHLDRANERSGALGYTRLQHEQGYRPAEYATSGAFDLAPQTELAQRFLGWGTALKPAAEHWLLARKPLSEPSVAANVLKWGTGGLNIDATRIGTDTVESHHTAMLAYGGRTARPWHEGHETTSQRHRGRWPANVLVSHAESCVLVGQSAAQSDGHSPAARGQGGGGTAGHRGQDGLEERSTAGEWVDVWACIPSCAVRLLDDQAGIRRSGYAAVLRRAVSRFFYTSKPSRAERDAGLEDVPESVVDVQARHRSRRMETVGRIDGAPPTVGRNSHPTPKALDLCRYLTRLVCPPGGLVLDPFAGSASIGCGAVLEGFRYLGIEREPSKEGAPDYVGIARRRLHYWLGQAQQQQAAPVQLALRELEGVS